ncbi:MAG: ABC transporter substrate-binding protein [Rhodococcus sp. (in: high G+C Gram-positive bacteria)]
MRKLLASPRPRALGLLAVAACVLTACGGGGSEPDTAAAATTADSAITVTDDLGSVVTLDAPAERIACLTLICVDALKEVGITPVAYREDLALDPRYAGPDAEMRKITGGFGEENVEDIALSEPDLVIGLGGVQDGLRGAVEEVAPMYLANPATWQDSVEFLRTVGELTARQAEANAAAEAFTAEVEAAAERRSEVTTLSMYGEPGSLGVDSVATPVGSLLAEVSNYPWQAGTDAFATVSVEQITAVDPDVVFAQAFSSGSDSEPLSDRLASNPLWAGISAAQNDRVIEVDAGVWATGRGTVSLRMVLETVMAELDRN